jgi:molybdate transport repressor ModE-like protein
MVRCRLDVGKTVRVEARVKVWLETDGRYVFGFGLSEILKAVEAAGSIKAAASRLGKSYRYVWGRIKKAETTLGQSLVETHVGGKGPCRSGLTDLARRLVADYDALRKRMFDVADEEFGHRFSRTPLPGRKRL